MEESHNTLDWPQKTRIWIIILSQTKNEAQGWIFLFIQELFDSSSKFS